MVNLTLSRDRKYYKETDGLKLDVGVYMKALEVERPSHGMGLLVIIIPELFNS